MGDLRPCRRDDIKQEVTRLACPPVSWSYSQPLTPRGDRRAAAAPASHPAVGGSLLSWCLPTQQVALGPGPALGAGSRVRRSREAGRPVSQTGFGLSGLGGAGLGARQT